VEIRTVLERIRPIDHKLKYQIDKLVKASVTGSIDSKDPSNFKANPANFASKVSTWLHNYLFVPSGLLRVWKTCKTWKNQGI